MRRNQVFRCRADDCSNDIGTFNDRITLSRAINGRVVSSLKFCCLDHAATWMRNRSDYEEKFPRRIRPISQVRSRAVTR